MISKTIAISILIVLSCTAYAPFSGSADLNFQEVFNLGQTINTKHFEGFPMIMPDGLTLYFSSNRPGGQGDLDIYIAQRTSVSDEWGLPVNLDMINSPVSDHSVTLSADGHYLFFMSKREGGYGMGDIYISYREDVTDAFGWEKPKNAGPILNSSKLESCPLFHVTEDRTELYFVSSRDGGLGEIDLYYSIYNDETGEFGLPVNMAEVNSPDFDMHFEPVKGLIWTNRPGGVGGEDIWIASFDRTDSVWKNPTPLTEPINTEYIEGMPSLTHDLSELYFHSNRPGGEGSHDIYMAKK